MQNKEKDKDLTLYTAAEAIKKAKEASKVKFDATVEVHINLNSDPKKQEHNVRYTTTLPNGTGKTKKVAVLASTKVPNADLVLTESDIDSLANGKIKPRIDFDVIVAEPRFMPKLAKAAKVLGPAGVMPNPKTGTVAEDVEKAVEQIKKGRIEVKTEKDAAVIHTIIGKASFEDAKLVENFDELMSSLKQNKPAKTSPDWIKDIFVSTSMGPSFKVNPVTEEL